MQLIKFISVLLVCFASSFSWAEKSNKNTLEVQFITNVGNFTVELYPKKAPITVKNFLKYVDEGFYNNTIFHRVIKGFMVQGGGFNQEFSKKATHAAIRNESNNGLNNSIATLSMARTSYIHSATSQFFINTQNNRSLDYRNGRHGYAVFGKVKTGYEVIKKIENQPTGVYRQYRDVPKKDIVIKKIIRR